MRFSIFQDSSIGGRQVNQDRMGYCFTRDSLVMVVADGLGGHFRGEIAAEIVIRSLAVQFQTLAKMQLRDPAFFLTAALTTAHREILAEALEKQYIETPRTTVACAVVQEGKLWTAHAGDSRVYLFREGVLIHRTRDHSKVQSLITLGLITQDEALFHPDRNKVLNCLGTDLEPLVELSAPIDLHPGDLVVLCTDGFWASLADNRIWQAMTSGALQDKLPGLIQEAVVGGGRNPDNSTAVVMLWEQPDPKTVESDISSDWLPDGALTTTINLSVADAQAIEAAPAMTDEEMQRTIDEIRDAIAQSEEKLLDLGAVAMIDNKVTAQKPLPQKPLTQNPLPQIPVLNSAKKSIE